MNVAMRTALVGLFLALAGVNVAAECLRCAKCEHWVSSGNLQLEFYEESTGEYCSSLGFSSLDESVAVALVPDVKFRVDAKQVDYIKYVEIGEGSGSLWIKLMESDAEHCIGVVGRGQWDEIEDFVRTWGLRLIRSEGSERN